MDKMPWEQILHRDTHANKYDFGHVLVIGGSAEMVGAPVLAARAALRIGAGLVTIASTKSATQLIDRDIEEMMTISLPEWHEVEECIIAVDQFVREREVTVAIIGPGLPEVANEVVRRLLVDLNVPIVVDALCFTALSGHLDTLKAAAEKNRLVLTPHPGEFARLISQVVNSKSEQDVAVQFARDYGVTLVIKHDHTLVVDQTGAAYTNSTGNPGMATAGAGDVLTGIVAGILAQKMLPYDAAKMAVYIHGLAADIAVRTTTQPGLIASDIIEAIPAALRSIDKK